MSLKAMARLGAVPVVLAAVLLALSTGPGYAAVRTVAPRPAAAPAVQTGLWRSLVNDDSGRCLDADTHTLGGNGTKVQLWDCNGQTQQQWIDYSDWVDGSTPINSFYTPLVNRCLDADLNTINGNGTKVQVWDCRSALNPVPFNQHWYQAVIA